ncbi:MAG: glycosyltransferase family 4 protein [Planctomycetes bacterium]|nr:glycosyltransferase family 4 protein [Planctomycetota bacterium]
MTARPRVIHVITRLILGGAQENTLLTVEGLHRRGWNVRLATGPAEGPEGELITRARRGGFPVDDVPTLRRAVRPVADAAAFLALARLFRRERPDIVHTHSSKAGILGRFAAAAAGVPRIFHTIHGLPFHPYARRSANALFIASERAAAAVTEKLVVVADAMRRKALAAGVGRPGQYVRVWSGMEVEPFLNLRKPREEIRRALGLPADALVCCKVARLFELKGHDFVLEAAAQADPRVHYLFVGDGLWRDRLARKAASLGLSDRIHFAGLVPPSDVPDCLHASDFLVHASLREGLARVLPQALLAGLPAISFDTDGANEVIEEGVTGLLVRPEDVRGLAAAINRVVADPSAARRWGERGREVCRERFSADAMVRALEGLYLSEEADRP